MIISCFVHSFDNYVHQVKQMCNGGGVTIINQINQIGDEMIINSVR